MKRYKVSIKDESKNEFGTFKDRRSNLIVKKALAAHVDKLCLITFGNAGFSLAKIAKRSGIKVVCIVDKQLKSNIKNTLREVSDKLIECDLSKKILLPEQVIALARENEQEVIWDVTNGYAEAYEEIIKELQNHKFDYLICPFGSGEAFVGLYNGLKKYKVEAQLVGVGVKESSSVADKLSTHWTPYKSKVMAILEEGHSVIKLTEDEVVSTYRKAKNKMECEISSAVVWAALDKFEFASNARIMILNSGRGLT